MGSFFSGKGAAAKRPAKKGAAYDRQKERARQRSKTQSASARDIAPLPAIVDPKRRAAALKSFRAFCDSYFPVRFNMPWSPDHVEVLEDFQRIITRGGVLALAMPRGSGKTSLAEVAVLWAIMCQGHRMVMLIAASKTKAKELVASVATEIEYNDRLMEDFPEVCYPVRQLKGVNQCKPLFQGQRIVVQVGKTQVLLPALPGTGFAGAIIRCGGLKGSDIRGASYLQPDGTRLRPSFFVADDPQTDASAKSDLQNDERELLLSGAVLGMAGPGKKISGVVPCTVIRPNDMADRILNLELHPDYGGRRYRLLKRIAPESELEPWRLYGEVRAEGLRAGDGGAAGNAYWLAHRKELEALAEPSWPERFKPDEVSAAQHAANLWLADRRSFYAEYQNDPAGAAQDDGENLDPTALIRRLNGLPRGKVPTSAEYLAAGIDIHDNLLYWTVVAAEQDPTMSVIDYGTWPKQMVGYFSLRSAPRTIKNHPDLKKLDAEGRLYEALTRLTKELVEMRFERRPGEFLSIGKIVIDVGWQMKLATKWCRQSPHFALLQPIKGSSKPELFSGRHAPGTREGVDFYLPPQNLQPVRVGMLNSDAWISRTVNGFLTPMGSRCAWTLFHPETPDTHRLFADHLTAESWSDWIDKRTGETHRKWQPKPSRPDNHWLDTTKMAAFGCFELGCKLAYVEKPKTNKAKKSFRYC